MRRRLSRISTSCDGSRGGVFAAALSGVFIVLIASLLMSGCGKETSPEPPEQKAVSEAKKEEVTVEHQAQQEVVSEPEKEKGEAAIEAKAQQEVVSKPEKEEAASEPEAQPEAISEPDKEREQLESESSAAPKELPGAEKETIEAASRPSAEEKEEQVPGPTPIAQELQKPQQEIPGVAFTEKLIELLNYELDERFWGWRPNDLLIGRLTDNVKEYQLGALEAIRYTAIKLKEGLTRLGDSDAYDPHLVEAVNLLMTRADQLWFPSTESQYELALEKLQAFLTDLKQGKSRFYYRTDNLLALIASYKDLLGNCHENLVKQVEPDGSRVSHFRADNYFYYCQGVAHVVYEMLETAQLGFAEQLTTIDAVALMDKIVEDLGQAAEISPWLITNSDAAAVLANHRYNLAAPISSALYKMSTMLMHGGGSAS